MILTAKEEIVVELYRALDPAQRVELVASMRALVDANRISQKKMKVPLRVVGNVRIEAKYGMPTPATGARKRPGAKPQRRRPDRGQDDAAGVE